MSLKLIGALKEYSKDNKRFSSQFFFKTLPPELQEGFNRLYLLDFGERIEDKDWVGKEMQKTLLQLEMFKIKEELQAIWQGLKGKGEKEEKIGEEEKKKILFLTQRLTVLEKAI